MTQFSGWLIVPAIERSFAGPDLPPLNLYMDTDVLIGAAVRTHEHHQRATALFNFLGLHDLTRTLYLSPLSWLEFVHVFRSEAFRKKLPPEFDQFNAVRGWANPAVRSDYLQHIRTTFEGLLSPYQWAEVPLTDNVLAQALQYMADYNLDAQDAAHLASARLAGVVDFASFDEKFRRVDWLILWNDRIHTGNAG